MILAEVITPWTGTGADEVIDRETGEIIVEADPFRPLIIDDYDITMSDTTGQPIGNLPPQPNIYVVWINVEANIADDIEADSTYYILWRGDEENQEPPANEFGQLRSFLTQAGVDQEEIDAAIGGSVGGRSRKEIVDDLKEWMRGLHKA